MLFSTAGILFSLAGILFSLAGILFSLAGCIGTQSGKYLFSADSTDDSPRSMEAIRKRIAAHPPSRGTNIALGVGEHSDHIVGQLLDNSRRWTFRHPLDTRPAIAGRVVVGSGGGELFALSAETGSLLWTRPTGGLPFRGAGDDGEITLISMDRAGTPGSTLLAVARDGSVVRQIETSQTLGSPAVVAGLAIVPWGGQYLSAFDLLSGDENSRVAVREKISRAWISGGALYFGELGIFRFDAKTHRKILARENHLAAGRYDLPGQPHFFSPGDRAESPAVGPEDLASLYVHPRMVQDHLVADDDRFYATYVRLIFGFAAETTNLAWVSLSNARVAAPISGTVTLELRRGDDYTILKTEAEYSAYDPEKLSMERSESGYAPEDRIGALEVQNLSVESNRAFLIHRLAQSMASPDAIEAQVRDLLG